MNDVSPIVAKDLELDMVRVLDAFLDVDPGIAKSLFGFRASCVVAFDQRDVIVSQTHSASAATRHGFQDHRIANLFRHRQSILFIFHQAIGTWWHWHTCFFG